MSSRNGFGRWVNNANRSINHARNGNVPAAINSRNRMVNNINKNANAVSAEEVRTALNYIPQVDAKLARIINNLSKGFTKQTKFVISNSNLKN
jgi:hypothetical protein